MQTHAYTPPASQREAGAPLRLFIIGDAAEIASRRAFSVVEGSQLDFCGSSSLLEDETALRRARAADVVLLDTLAMPAGARAETARSTLKALLRQAPGLHVISIVAEDDRDAARAAARAGSWDVVELSARDLRERLLIAARLSTLSRDTQSQPPHGQAGARLPMTLREARRIAERKTLRQALEHVSGNKTAAARVLGISRTQLYELMRRHGLLA